MSASGDASEGLRGPSKPLPELEEWDPATFQTEASPFPSVVVLAARGEGKTTALKAILTEHVRIKGGRRGARTAGPGFDGVFVFSNSVATLAAYAFLPAVHTRARDFSNFVRLEDDPGAIERLIRAQEDVRAGGRTPPRLLVILDDVLGSVRSNAALNRIYTQGRHASIACVLVVQAFTTDLATSIRKNTDLWLSLRVRSGPERKAFSEEVLAGCVSVEDEDRFGQSDKVLARRLYNAHTSNFGVIVADHRVRETGAAAMLFHWRAPAPEKSRRGAQAGDEIMAEIRSRAGAAGEPS